MKSALLPGHRRGVAGPLALILSTSLDGRHLQHKLFVSYILQLSLFLEFSNLGLKRGINLVEEFKIRLFLLFRLHRSLEYLCNGKQEECHDTLWRNNKNFILVTSKYGVKDKSFKI